MRIAIFSSIGPGSSQYVKDLSSRFLRLLRKWIVGKYAQDLTNVVLVEQRQRAAYT